MTATISQTEPCLERPAGARRGHPKRHARVSTCLLGAAIGLLLCLGNPALGEATPLSPLRWAAPVRADQDPPFATRARVSATSCPSPDLCVAVDNSGDVLHSTTPASADAGAWSIARLEGSPALTALSCPSEEFCVAGDSEGHVVASTEPSGPASSWQRTDTGAKEGIDSMSCPSTALCVGTTFWQGLVVSTDPASADPQWQVVSPGSSSLGLRSVACPSPELCVVGAGDEILTSSSPTDAQSWQASQVAPPNREILDISCPTAQFCAATDDFGEALTSTDPQGGATAWSATEAGGGINGPISCSTIHLCVVAGDSALFVSTNPTGGISTWSSKPLSVTPADVTCATDTFCIASTNKSSVLVSSSPAGEAGSWEPVQLSIGFNALDGVSCASLQLCVAVDNAGNVVSTQQPDVPGSPWSSAHVSDHPLYAVDCPAVTLCVAVGKAGTLLWSSEPWGPAASWNSAVIDEGRSLTGVDCASVDLCVAIDGSGQVLHSSEPLAGGGSWNADQIAGEGDLLDIACASSELCMTLAGERPVVSTDPLGGPQTWEWVPYEVGQRVSCPSPALCVGVNFPNKVAWSNDPAGDDTTWRAKTVEALNGLEDIGCAADWLCVATTYAGNGSSGNVLVAPLPLGSSSNWVADNVYGKAIVPPDHILSLYEPLSSGVSCVPEGLCVVVDRGGYAMMARPALPPANVSPPSLEGVPEVGEVIHCRPGEWSGEPAPALAFAWLRNGTEIGAGTDDSYQITPADAQQELSCEVTATNGAGQVSATSESVSVPAVKASPAAAEKKSEEALALESPGQTRPGFRILKVALGPKDVLGMTLLAPGPGHFTARAEINGISGSSARRQRGSGSACEDSRWTRAYGRGAGVAIQSGRTKLQVRPREQARTLLARGDALCFKVTVTYRSPTSTTVRRDRLTQARG